QGSASAFFPPPAPRHLQLAAALAPATCAKGMRCTVPGLTPNLAAALRTDRPPLRASRIRSSSASGIGGRPSRRPRALVHLPQGLKSGDVAIAPRLARLAPDPGIAVMERRIVVARAWRMTASGTEWTCRSGVGCRSVVLLRGEAYSTLNRTASENECRRKLLNTTGNSEKH